MAQELAPAGRLAIAHWTEALITTPVDDTTIGTWINGLSSTTIAKNLTDVTLGTSPIYANTNTRGNTAGGFSSQKPVLREGEATFEFLWATTDSTGRPTSLEQILVDRANDLQEIAFGFFDYDPTTAASGEWYQGLVGNWYVAVEKSEAIEDVQRFSATLTVGSGARWYKAQGSP